MSSKEKIKVKAFLNKMWLKSIPVFLNKENSGKEEELAILYPVLRNFFNEQAFLKEVTKFCEDSDEFNFAQKMKSENPLHLKLQARKNLVVYSQKKGKSEHDLFMTNIMFSTEESLDVFMLSIQQKEDFYEIIFKENTNLKEIHLPTPEELIVKSFSSVAQLIKNKIRTKTPVVWRLQMFNLQEMAQEKVCLDDLKNR